MPLLETINPGVRAALARTADLAREELEVLRSDLPSITNDRTGISIGDPCFCNCPRHSSGCGFGWRLKR